MDKVINIDKWKRNQNSIGTSKRCYKSMISLFGTRRLSLVPFFVISDVH
ncbi:hypothetical protein PRVXT_000362 [Proteinivorax tanatarense]|uniref:Uncharacterized protein n=1 Tax=Proteinivorax tanatarense TaxID=1260629 RepID=A0AAU7VN38_9FIRM